MRPGLQSNSARRHLLECLLHGFRVGRDLLRLQNDLARSIENTVEARSIDMEAIHGVLSAEQREQFDAAVAVELKKGEASFHHPRLVHGSFANHSDRAAGQR
jgi:ectoine hydroxylase-related dioxygenase (phytanoyl-CoA dioxygenase family)